MRKNFEAWAGNGSGNLTERYQKWHATTQYQRARRVVGRSGGLMRGKFPSQKNQRMVHWESQLERDAIFLFEYLSVLRRYREQPLTTFYTADGRTHRYTPDFELTFLDGSKLIVEIKPSNKLERPEVKRKFDLIREHFASKGEPFLILTEIEIQQPHLQHNLRVAQRYRRPPLSALERYESLRKLNHLQTISFSTAEKVFGSVNEVWALIGERFLIANLHCTVDEETTLTVNLEGGENAELYF